MKRQQRKALFVGIDKYTRGIQELSCARNDADCLYDYFKDHRYKVHVVHDATTDDMLDELDEQMKTLQPDDLFLFFFAGHGYTVEGENGLDRRLAGSSDRRNRILTGEGGISLRELKERAKIARCACVVILDACQTRINANRAANDVPCEEYSARDLAAISSVVMDEGETGLEQPFVVINSCDVGEVAYELTGKNQGLFSSAFLSVLKQMEQTGEDPSFNKEFIDRVAMQMTEHGSEYRQHPTIIANNASMGEMKVFPIKPGLDGDVRKWFARIDDHVDLKAKHFAEDLFGGRDKFKYGAVLRNLIRLFSLPEFDKVIKSQYGVEIKPEDGADVIEAFYEMNELMTKPRQVPAEQNMMPLREPKTMAKSGLPLSSRDKNLLADLEGRLKRSDGRLPRINGVAKKNLSDIGRMSQPDAVAALDVLARERMRKLCGREDRNWLYHCRERNCWHERFEKGLLASDFERAIYRFVCDDECLVPETSETFE